MDLTTPNALKPHVLQAACLEAGWDPTCPVRGSVVVARALELAGVPSEHAERATRNANWVATQTLRKEGLLSSSDKRGYWVVTLAGLAAAGGPAVPAHEGDSASSSWADDPEGLVDGYRPADLASYHSDEYILALAMAHTPCVGAYLGTDTTCQTCPLSAGCQQVQFMWLNEHMQPPTTPPMPTPATTPRKVMENILDSIDSEEDATPPPPPKASAPPSAPDTFTVATKGSKCCLCGALLPEGSNVIWVPGAGVRHIMMCP